MSSEAPLRTEQALKSADRPVRQSCQIFRQQIDCALDDLAGGRARVLNVHGARKQLKRARATLRLLRSAIGDDVYRRENIAARDAARPLSHLRDSEILLDTLARLVARIGQAGSFLNLEPLQKSLGEHRRGLAGGASEPRQSQQIRRALQRVKTRSTRWEITEDRWRVLALGLSETYRKGRQALREARNSRTIEHLHDWRKQAKYLWLQLQMLAPITAGAVGELADEFHHLSDYLGDEHDLAVLRARAFERPHGLDERSGRALKTLIDRRRAELEGKAFALGERLYEEKPSVFEYRMTQHWLRWAERRAPLIRGIAAIPLS